MSLSFSQTGDLLERILFPKELQKILAKIFYESETSDKEMNLSKITDYESPGKLMAYAYQICA